MDVCLNLRCVFLLFFLVEVSRNPPMTAQPKPKNISWACHCTAVNEAAGDGMTPEKTNTQRSGRVNQDKQASVKNGRKPASQSGYADNFILHSCCQGVPVSEQTSTFHPSLLLN